MDDNLIYWRNQCTRWERLYGMLTNVDPKWLIEQWGDEWRVVQRPAILWPGRYPSPLAARAAIEIWERQQNAS